MNHLLYSFLLSLALLLGCDKTPEYMNRPTPAHPGWNKNPDTEKTPGHTLIGANFNENIQEIAGVTTELVRDSIPYIRSFINITPFLERNNGGITGVRTASIQNSTLPAEFVKARTDVPSAKLVLSMKCVFKNIPGNVPAKGSAGAGFVADCYRQVLEKDGLGGKISVLVLGNEPMWENWNTDTSNEPASNAQNYADLIELLAKSMNDLKKQHGWDFKVFVGALNRFSIQHSSNETIKKLMPLVSANTNIDGLDLHIHADNVSECGESLKLVRETYGIKKELMCSEISMVWKVSKIMKNTGTYTWLNDTARKVLAGTPVSREAFRTKIESLGGYPKGWFTTFYKSMDEYHVSFATPRFSVVESDTVIDANTTHWELGGIYSARFLGRNPDGTMVSSPLLYEDYAAARR